MPSSDWTPDVSRVGAILRARTKDTVGDELGTFTAETRPTEVEVVNLIADAVDDVASLVGTDIPQPAWDTAKYVAALGTSLFIELSYFPEQINNGSSPYPQLKAMYDQRLQQLLKLIETEEGGGGGGGGVPGAPFEPVASFPIYPSLNMYDPGAIGRGTRW